MWKGESQRHVLSARGIKNEFSVKNKYSPTGYSKRTPYEFETLEIGSNEYEQHVQSLIDRHNEYYGGETRPIIVFDNYPAAHLWVSEFLGQISDGKYENDSFVGRHYREFFNTNIQIGPTAKIIGYVPHWWDTKRVSFKDLIWLFDSNNLNNAIKEIEAGTFHYQYPSQKETLKNLRDQYKTDVRMIFSKVPTEQLKKYIDNVSYTLYKSPRER